MLPFKTFYLLGLLSISSNIVLAQDLSTYIPNTGLLTVQDLDIGANQHYYLEFRHQGNSSFLLTDSKPLTAASGFQQPAYFNANTKIATIPSVNSSQQYYSVDLRYNGGSSFTLARVEKATPPNAILPVNPPQNNGQITTSTLQGKWQGTYSCSQGETNIDMDIDDSLTAKIRIYASNSNQGAFDGYYFGNIKLNSNVVSFQIVENVKDDAVTFWSVRPKGAIFIPSTSVFNITVTQNNLSMSGEMGTTCSSIKLTKTQNGSSLKTEEEIAALDLSTKTLLEQGQSAVTSCIDRNLQCDRFTTAATELFSICEKKNYLAACYYGHMINQFYSRYASGSLRL